MSFMQQESTRLIENFYFSPAAAAGEADGSPANGRRKGWAAATFRPSKYGLLQNRVHIFMTGGRSAHLTVACM